MEFYNRQPARFEESNDYQHEIPVDSKENLDINTDKDIADVKFTIDSMRAVTEPFARVVDELLQEKCEEVDYCL